MASQQALDALVVQVSNIFLSRCFAFATFTLVLYEWLISARSGFAGYFLDLLITWYKMCTSYRGQGKVLNGSSVVRVILYNGSVYLIIITGLNVLNVIIEAVPNIPRPVYIAGSVTVTPLTTVLVSRFFLDLQQAAGRTAATPSAPSLATSIDFAPVDNDSAATSRGPGTLAAFIASMGSDIHMGLHAANSARVEGETQTDEGGTGEISVQRYEEEFALVDMAVEVNATEVR